MHSAPCHPELFGSGPVASPGRKWLHQIEADQPSPSRCLLTAYAVPSPVPTAARGRDGAVGARLGVVSVQCDWTPASHTRSDSSQKRPASRSEMYTQVRAGVKGPCGRSRPRAHDTSRRHFMRQWDRWAEPRNIGHAALSPPLYREARSEAARRLSGARQCVCARMRYSASSEHFPVGCFKFFYSTVKTRF